MSFKEMLSQDIHDVFLNPEEFAEFRTLIYRETRYENIPVSIQDFEEVQRERVNVSGVGRAGSDNAPGLYRTKKILYCARSSLGGVLPERGDYIQVNSAENPQFLHKYHILASGCELGLLRLELQEIRQGGWS